MCSATNGAHVGGGRSEHVAVNRSRLIWDSCALDAIWEEVIDPVDVGTALSPRQLSPRVCLVHPDQALVLQNLKKVITSLQVRQRAVLFLQLGD